MRLSTKWILSALIAVCIAVVVASIIAASQGDDDTRVSEHSEDALQSGGAGVLEQSEAVFQGGYSKEEIKTALDQAMTLYGLEITEQTYDRATNALVGLRQEFDVEEMDILDCMIRSHVPGLEITFADAAGVATAFLASAGEC